MEELKTCPFCGATGIHWVNPDTKKENEIVCCPNGECIGHEVSGEAKDWNTRIPPATASKGVDVGKLAESVFRPMFVPLYPTDKPINEMTSYEQGMYKQTLMLATAIKDAIEKGEV